MTRSPTHIRQRLPAPWLAAPLLIAAGCAQENDRVEVSATGDVEFGWDLTFNESEDGLAAFVPLDVMVLDGLSGEPLSGVRVAWRSETASFVDALSVRVGEVDCETCLWDAYGDAFVEVEDSAEEVPFYTHTDEDGLARVYTVVDAVEIDDMGFLPVHIDVQAAGHARMIDLIPR